jgi:hypothetical protein
MAALCEAFKATKAGLNALNGIYKASMGPNRRLKGGLKALESSQFQRTWKKSKFVGGG